MSHHLEIVDRLIERKSSIKFSKSLTHLFKNNYFRCKNEGKAEQ